MISACVETVWPHIAILGFVTLQRLGEIGLARQNRDALLGLGALEVARRLYPPIVAVQAAWLASLWYLALGRDIVGALVVLFVLIQLARVWVIRTLGPRWTTRLIVLPGTRPVTAGPFRYLPHADYAVVVAEIAILPLAFGLPVVAIVFSAANAALLAMRLAAQNKAERS